MKPFRHLSIRAKLALAFMASGIVPLLFAVALLLGYELSVQRARIVDQLAAQAAMIAVSTHATLEFEDPKRATETLATLAARPEIIAACLYTREGEVFARYVRRDAQEFHFPALGVAGHQFEGGSAELLQPIGQGRDLSGHIFLRADLGILRARFPHYALVAGAALLGLMAVSFGIARAFQRSISRPILALSLGARKVQEARDYSIRVPKRGEDEVGHLTEAFNQMLAGIEERDSSLRRLNENLQSEINERQAAEDKIKLRSAELEASNKELEAFSYSISHDLRAPLRSIDGFSKILLRQHQDELSPEGREALDLVRANAQQMGRMIDDLLAFARLNRVAVLNRVVDHDSLVEECLGFLRDEIIGKSVMIEVGHLPSSRGDPALLKHVWLNLLSNAIKYSRARQPARIEIGSIQANGSVTYHVRDNGAGFDMQYAHKLFGVFQRLHRAEDYEGVGVGLAVAQRIIQRHHGRIWAEGEVDKGAAFYFTLPAEEPPRPPHHQPGPLTEIQV